jgi:hypothetical protein
MVRAGIASCCAAEDDALDMRFPLLYEAASTHNSAPKRSPVFPTGVTAGMNP